MKYTIEQINEAWIEFNKQIIIVNKSEPITEEMLDAIKNGLIHPNLQSGHTTFIQRQDFISFLIDYFRKK